jgi:hypothetical protein
MPLGPRTLACRRAAHDHESIDRRFLMRDYSRMAATPGSRELSPLPELAEATVISSVGCGDPRPLRDWLAGQLVHTGAMSPSDFRELAEVAQWNSAVNEARSTGIHDLAIEPSAARVTAIVHQAMAAAAKLPLALPLLILYLRTRCEAAWEASWDHRPMRQVIAAAEEALDSLSSSAINSELAIVALKHLEILGHELTVETAAQCGSLGLWANEAGRTASFARDVSEAADHCRASLTGQGTSEEDLLNYLNTTAKDEISYYTAVSSAASTVREHFFGRKSFDEAISGLATVEALDIDDIDRSELRAHRLNLEVLRTRSDLPWLRIGSGRMVYLYPFGLRGVTPGEAVTALRENGDEWELAGLPVTAVAENLLLNDVWQGHDPLGRQYGGAGIHLPDIEVPSLEAGTNRSVNVELRLSSLGNHYLRLSFPLEDAGPNDIYALMLQAAPEYGDLTELGRTICPHHADVSAPQWGRLCDFATALIEAVAMRLGETQQPSIAASCRPGMYHVLLSIDRAAAVEELGSKPLADARELVTLFGAQPLLHPIRHGVSSIGEWIRYSSNDLTNVNAPGLEGDLLGRTTNTTLLFAPGSPSYMISAAEEAAEFVATLPGLFANWQDDLAAKHRDVTTELDRLNNHSDPLNPLSERLPGTHDLEARRFELHEFVVQRRLILMFIEAPTLVTSGIMRTTLDRLLDAAKFHRLRDEFIGMSDAVLGRLGTLLDESARRLEEQRAEHTRKAEKAHERRVEALATFIAAVGLSGLAEILQAGYHWTGHEALIVVMVVVLIALGIGGLVGLISHYERNAQ